MPEVVADPFAADEPVLKKQKLEEPFEQAPEKLFVKKSNPKAIIPKKGSELAAGFDLSAVEATIIP